MISVSDIVCTCVRVYVWGCAKQVNSYEEETVASYCKDGLVNWERINRGERGVASQLSSTAATTTAGNAFLPTLTQFLSSLYPSPLWDQGL